MDRGGYEYRVWHRGWGDWAWEARAIGATPFASGATSKKEDAKDEALVAIDARLERVNAPWTRAESD